MKTKPATITIVQGTPEWSVFADAISQYAEGLRDYNALDIGDEWPEGIKDAGEAADRLELQVATASAALTEE